MKKHNTESKIQKQHQQQELSWRRAVVRKWLNLSKSNSDYSADSDSDSGSGSDAEQESCDWPKESRYKNDKPDELQVDDLNEAPPRIRRRKSETFRAQYINSKEIKICAATWNVGGKIPPDDLDLDGLLNIDEPADVYVVGFQEMIPLNAGNIFGAEDNRPAIKWENLIRETLNRVPPMTKFKSYSDPPSPSSFMPCEDAVDIVDEVLLESYSDAEEEFPIYPVTDEPNGGTVPTNVLERQFSSPKMLDRLYCVRNGDPEENVDTTEKYVNKLTKSLSGRERIGLSWPEPPLHLLGQRALERPNSLGSTASFKGPRSIKTYSSFNSVTVNENRMRTELASLVELDLESLINRKRRPPYVRIVSKQMVGIFITIWVRRSLRRRIQNVNVSTVGVGIMGYIGNKGSVSVSMSIHQTVFCFICSHLTSGEREADAVKRNADVHEINNRTRFNFRSGVGWLPTRIYDHERIIWLGDLNYRINLSYERTRELISKKDWRELLERDQLIREFKKGRAFDGWSEGTLSFAPTYKYELNSDSYIGEDPKGGRRTPAWCDRILSYGSGMKLLGYGRSEVRLSDHRPVRAYYTVEVEVFSPKKLIRALTFTNAEIEQHDIVTDMGVGNETGLLSLEEDVSYWDVMGT
ncbi:hypothetical protein ACS0TY_023655 [Phlomoides rotata]